MIHFSLIPYGKTKEIQVLGAVRHTGSALSLWYHLYDIEGAVECRETSSTRQDKLWQNTCFELFCGVQGSSEYWELNITPSGAWNVYAFSAPRTEMRQEEKCTNISSFVYKSNNSITLHCNFDIAKILPPNAVLELGVSSVVAFTDDTKGYWALAHNKSVPDFHDRSAFIIKI